ncbi:hypothetical protein Tco_0555371 [Tanacetum coccineum]
MSEFNELFDVKVCVRSFVKLLPKIKLLLSSNPNRLRLFRRTVFGPWLDIPSHDNDNHLMYYVLEHQRVFLEKVTETCVKKKKSCELLALVSDNKGWSGLSDIDVVRVYLLIVAELVFMGKEDKNCIPMHIVSLVEDLDAWNDYPWGEYLWDKFYKRIVNVVALHRDHHLVEMKKNLNFNATYNLYGFVWAFKIWILESYPNSKIWWFKKENVLPHGLAWTKISKFEKSHYNRLFGPVSIPNVDLYSTPAEKREAWFIASIPFINGPVDEDRNGCGDDSIGVSQDNSVDRQHEYGYEDETVNETFLDEDGNACGDASTCVSKDNVVDRQHQLGYADKRVNEKSVENNDQLLLENRDGVLDSERGGINNEADNVNQLSNVSIANLFVNVHALRKEVALIKVDDERIENLERLLKEKLQNDFAAEKTKPNIIPNESDDIVKCSIPNVTSNHTSVDQGLGGSANYPMSTCSRPNMHNAEVACDGMSIDKPDGMNDYSCSQRIPVTLDVLIKACAYSNKHPELDVLQHDNHVDRSVPKLNQHSTAEPLPDQSNKPKYVNVVRDDYKPPLETIFGYVKSKKKKCGIRKNYVLRSVKERKKRLAMALDSPYRQQGTTTPALPKIRSMSSIRDTIVAPEFEENLSRPDGCQRDKGFWDIPVGPIFWLTLACLDKTKQGWLQDSPDADWAMVSPHFLPSILGGSMPDYFSNGVRYHVPWRDVEKGNKRPWWRTMRRTLPQQLTSYLNEHGVLESKGISVEGLSRKQPLAFRDPLQTALAYRKRILQYIWNHKVEAPKTVLMDEDCHKILLGFGVLPDTLDPTIIKISYPQSGQGNWYVSVFTMSSLTWNQFANNCLPRESIRFKRSSQAVVGGYIYCLGHERFVSDSGVCNKKTLLVSFDMITHQFEVIDIPDNIIRALSFPLYISNLRNSLVLSGSVFPPDYFVFCAQLLSIHVGSITLFTTIFTIASPHFLKLLGFNNQDEPIVEVATNHYMAHSVQVYNPDSESF